MYIVKNLKAMNYLVMNGFECLELEKDRFNANKVVFKFLDTPAFREVWTKYCNEHRKIR